MRIVHISDLHFGQHNKLLKATLPQRIKALKADVIVCTGDLADNPDKKPLAEAYEYLDILQAACSSRQDLKIIVVPGNHDYREKGFLWQDRKRPYLTIFGAGDADHYYEKDNVWIFGFDSASGGPAGGGGLILESDLERFHERYAMLQDLPAFKDAFKIVAVHHHPLPVNWDSSWRDRWLTMANAGAFLSAVLFRRIDLVLHGEHLQARARLWSTLGDNDHETTIVSLGATLRRVDNPNRNWLGLIDIQPHGAHVEFYGSVGGAAFGDKPDPRFEIRSRSQAADLDFVQARRDAGYGYREVAALTVLDKDGDGRRRLEFEGLLIHNQDSERTRLHLLRLPPTSGYLDCLTVTGASFDPIIAKGSRNQDHSGTITFDQPLAVDEPHNYSCSWYAVNAFAMDTRQFDFLHTRDAKKLNDIEYTHFTVSDPIEELAVVVKFPEGFTPVDGPRLRVTKPTEDPNSRGWESQPELENRLNRDHALRYYETLNIAAVRIHRPTLGLSYGIRWGLPKTPKQDRDQHTQSTRELQDLWIAQRANMTQKELLTKMLARIIIGVRKGILQGWEGPIDASFMYFDGQHHMRLLTAILDEHQEAIEHEYDITLRYGDGIAGRAFKINQIRVYTQSPDDDSQQPDYYTPCTDGPPHKCLLSIPIRPPVSPDSPATVRNPYGVLSLGSTRADCPIALVGLPGGPAPLPELRLLHDTINGDVYKSMLAIFLDPKHS